MTSNQKRVASWIAVGILIATLLTLAWLAYLAGNSNFVDDPNGENPKLHLSWKAALWFIITQIRTQPVWLQCCCSPKSCHAQVIGNAIQWMTKQTV